MEGGIIFYLTCLCRDLHWWGPSAPGTGGKGGEILFYQTGTGMQEHTDLWQMNIWQWGKEIHKNHIWGELSGRVHNDTHRGQMVRKKEEKYWLVRTQNQL